MTKEQSWRFHAAIGRAIAHAVMTGHEDLCIYVKVSVLQTLDQNVLHICLGLDHSEGEMFKGWPWLPIAENADYCAVVGNSPTPWAVALYVQNGEYITALNAEGV